MAWSYFSFQLIRLLTIGLSISPDMASHSQHCGSFQLNALIPYRGHESTHSCPYLRHHSIEPALLGDICGCITYYDDIMHQYLTRSRNNYAALGKIFHTIMMSFRNLLFLFQFSGHSHGFSQRRVVKGTVANR